MYWSFTGLQILLLCLLLGLRGQVQITKFGNLTSPNTRQRSKTPANAARRQRQAAVPPPFLLHCKTRRTMSTSNTSTEPTSQATRALKDPDFHWSLDGRSRNLHSYRESVKEGLDRSFERYRLGAMQTEDSEWLASSQGQYKAYFSWTSRQVQQYRLRKEVSLNIPSQLLCSCW